MRKPVLSICIPTYNRKVKLMRMLDILLPQCMDKDIEIVISDNASEDGTREYCLQKESKYAFLHYSCQKKNNGFSYNLIYVLNKAKGKYVWTLGDDEILHHQAVLRVLKAIAQSEPNWLLCNFVKLNSPDSEWPVDTQISYKDDLYSIPLEKVLGIAGIWSSFMSINIIKRELYVEWSKENQNRESDYIGFDIALFAGIKGGCFILSSPILARIKEPLMVHRFDKLAVYFFDFFEPLDQLVKQKILTKRIRIEMANEMFFSMAGFLLLSAKINNKTVPSIGTFVKYHSYVPLFWLIIFPLLLSPSWFVRFILKIVFFIVPKNSKLNRLALSLGI